MSTLKPDSLEEARFARDLANLPLCEPKQSAWPAIESRLKSGEPANVPDRPAGQTRRVQEWFLALAATLAVGVLAAFFTNMDTAEPMSPNASPSTSQLAALILESQQLESRLTDIRAGNFAPESISELEGYLALVDLQLASNDGNIELWQQRVALLDTLVETKTRLATNPTYQL